MKLITNERAFQLSKMLLENDKNIKEELLMQINNNHMEITKQMSEVNGKLNDVDEKINTATTGIATDDIDTIFNNQKEEI